MTPYQKEADRLLKELEQDLNNLLPEGSKSMRLLFQEVQPDKWVGRFYGYHQGKLGHYQFSVNMETMEIKVAQES